MTSQQYNAVCAVSGSLASLFCRFDVFLHPTVCSFFVRKCTDASVVALSKLPCLEKLILNWCAITDGGLYVLSSVVQPRALRSLSLNFCSMITDNGISYLRTITTLQHLNMEICKGVTGLSLQHIAELGDLRRLTVSRQTDDEGLRQLRPLTRLEALKLNYCWYSTVRMELHHLKFQGT